MSDGMNYAPQGKPRPVVAPGEFAFAVIGLDHGHIYGQCNGLIEAGADLVAVYDQSISSTILHEPPSEEALKALWLENGCCEAGDRTWQRRRNKCT